MQNLMVRKACCPGDTLRRIEQILKTIGIETVIVSDKMISQSVYSIRIEIKDFSGMGTNGKGVTRMLAMASAYAEFMERLQGGLLLTNTFLNKDRKELGIFNIKKYELILPTCPKCSICKCKDSCKYLIWKKHMNDILCNIDKFK